MYEEINESVQVAALFKHGELVPLKFLWKGREFLVRVVNLSYSRYEGRAKVYYFAVSDNNNYFKLRFNSDDFNWVLSETYVD